MTMTAVQKPLPDLRQAFDLNQPNSLYCFSCAMCSCTDLRLNHIAYTRFSLVVLFSKHKKELVVSCWTHHVLPNPHSCCMLAVQYRQVVMHVMCVISLCCMTGSLSCVSSVSSVSRFQVSCFHVSELQTSALRQFTPPRPNSPALQVAERRVPVCGTHLHGPAAWGGPFWAIPMWGTHTPCTCCHYSSSGRHVTTGTSSESCEEVQSFLHFPLPTTSPPPLPCKHQTKGPPPLRLLPPSLQTPYVS